MSYRLRHFSALHRVSVLLLQVLLKAAKRSRWQITKTFNKIYLRTIPSTSGSKNPRLIACYKRQGLSQYTSVKQWRQKQNHKEPNSHSLQSFLSLKMRTKFRKNRHNKTNWFNGLTSLQSILPNLCSIRLLSQGKQMSHRIQVILKCKRAILLVKKIKISRLEVMMGAKEFKMYWSKDRLQMSERQTLQLLQVWM